MVESIGIDIVEVDRMRSDLERYGERFLQRILSSDELAILSSRTDRATFLAGRFACKEAVIKALGRFLDVRPTYTQINVVNDDTGRPYVTLPDDVTARLSGAGILVSISHERSYAVAMAVIRS
jgi:holo-[acyl-carrier protein] synthase